MSNFRVRGYTACYTSGMLGSSSTAVLRMFAGVRCEEETLHQILVPGVTSAATIDNAWLLLHNRLPRLIDGCFWEHARLLYR